MGDSVLQFLDERSSVHSQPSDVNGGLHGVNFVLDVGQEGDLLVESFEIWSLGLDSIEDLLGHPFECLVFLFFAIGVDFDVFLLSWADSCVQEGLETLLECLFPKELLILILVDEIFGGLNDVIELVSDILHGTEQVELVLDLNQVVTRVGVKSWHLNRNGDEVVQNLLDDISNSVSLGLTGDWWIEDHLSISQVDLDVEHWGKQVVLVVGDGDLVGQESHGGLDSFSDTFNH